MTPDTSAILLLWGDDAFLLRDAALAAFGAVRPTEVDASEWRPGLTADLATPSLFGEERGLLVTEAQDLPDEAIDEIAAYAGVAAPGARLVLAVVVSPRAKGPPRGLLKGLGKDIEQRRVAVERKDLTGWVVERARRRELPATPQGAAALVQTLGDDPAILDQALEQLSSSHPSEGLTPETVAEQFRGLGDARLWEVCDAAFTGDLRKAMRALEAMLAAGDEPLAILGGIAARLRELIRVQAVPPEASLGDLAKQAGLRFDWQGRRYRDQARRYPPGALEALHRGVVETDRAVKQGAGRAEILLEMLVAAIAEAPEGTKVPTA
ncbi:MAG TPA: DNA polymerase III subunit delta [Actinomycetota bacterium]|nr:DNA polymerase III subunit delta [Actinomycetota bacterium]